MNIDLLLCILGMALVTLIPRVMPVTLLAGRELPPLLTRWLSFVPVSVLAALVAPDLLLADGKLNISGDNLFLIATFPTLLICWYKKPLNHFSCYFPFFAFRIAHARNTFFRQAGS